MSENNGDEKALGQEIPNPEVKPSQTKAKKRRYLTGKYKLEILRKADACQDKPGELGALLRREGLYSSHISKWRRERDQGLLLADSQTTRGPQRKISEVEAENLRLRSEYNHLKLKLDQAQKIIAVQKKISEILELTDPENKPPEKHPGKS